MAEQQQELTDDEILAGIMRRLVRNGHVRLASYEIITVSAREALSNDEAATLQLVIGDERGPDPITVT